MGASSAGPGGETAGIMSDWRPNSHPYRVSGQTWEKKMERETGIEPATNGLEGRDSTTELLPRLSLSAFEVVQADGFEPP